MDPEEEIRDAYHTIHDNLQWMPVEYCCWKKKTSDGRVVSKSLSGDYRPLFRFVKNNTLRNNIAELMFCLDYHRSLFRLHKPGLTFGWQHKLVLCQIAAGIYEGILLDIFEQHINSDGEFAKTLGKQKLDNKSFGLGALVDTFTKTKILTERWRVYLLDLIPLRNTVHPRSLNHEDASYQQNSIIKGTADDLTKNLEAFLIYSEGLYPL